MCVHEDDEDHTLVLLASTVTTTSHGLMQSNSSISLNEQHVAVGSGRSDGILTNRLDRRDITTVSSGPSLTSGIQLGLGLGLGLGGGGSTTGFRHTLSSSSIHDALYVPSANHTTTEQERGLNVLVSAVSGSGIVPGTDSGLGLDSGSGSGLPSSEGVMAALMNVRGSTTHAHSTAMMIAGATTGATASAAALATTTAAGQSSTSSSSLAVYAVIDVYHFSANSPPSQPPVDPSPVFAHVSRIRITEPSLQRPDILVYQHQQQQHHIQQSHLRHHHDDASRSTGAGCVVVASTQSNHLLLYSLTPPHHGNLLERTEMTQSKGVLNTPTHTPPVNSSVQGKITLPPGHLVRGVCFGPGLGLPSEHDNNEEKEGGEVWVLSLMKEKRGATSLASIGDPHFPHFFDS